VVSSDDTDNESERKRGVFMSKREYERGKEPGRYDSNTSSGSFVYSGIVVQFKYTA
jgi:hypothetical protein